MKIALIYWYQRRRWLLQKHYLLSKQYSNYWFVDWIPRISKSKRRKMKKEKKLSCVDINVLLLSQIYWCDGTRYSHAWLAQLVSHQQMCMCVCYHRQHLYANDNKIIYKTSHLRWEKCNTQNEKKDKIQNACKMAWRRRDSGKKAKQRQKKFANYHTFFTNIFVDIYCPMLEACGRFRFRVWFLIFRIRLCDSETLQKNYNFMLKLTGIMITRESRDRHTV